MGWEEMRRVLWLARQASHPHCNPGRLGALGGIRRMSRSVLQCLSWMIAVLLGAHLVFAPSSLLTSARADSLEGHLAFGEGRKEEGIRLLRRAAWQENSFSAQIKLGEIYAARGNDKTYHDNVEAFVWYFLATRNSSIMDHLHLDETAQKASEQLAEAETSARKLYSNLLQEERADVRNRVIYIQSCRGADGYLLLGMLHDPNITRRHSGEFQAAPGLPNPIVRPFFRPGSPFNPTTGGGFPGGGFGAPPSTLPNGQPATPWPILLCRESSWWGWLYGDPTSCSAPAARDTIGTIFGPSAIEALVFYNLAYRARHPLAQTYVDALKAAEQRFYEDQELIANEKTAREKSERWLAPFEYYAAETRTRGETPSGLVHTDECPVNAARARALALADKLISPYLLTDMLKFLGFHRDDGAPVSIAIRKYQDMLGEEETGNLTPIQKVRLFQIAAVRGYVRAQRCLGIMYVKGIGVVRDYVRAEKWLLLAAEQSDGEAMYALSELYSSGADGIAKAEDKANRYRQGAATSGFLPAKAEFLRLLETGPVRADEQAPAQTEGPVVQPGEEPRPAKKKKRRRRSYSPGPDDGVYGE